MNIKRATPMEAQATTIPVRGGLAHTIGRRPLIVAEMLIQAAALTLLALSGGVFALAVGAATLLGLGTALVYPTLIAAMSDAVSPSPAPRWSASIASGVTWATRSAR